MKKNFIYATLNAIALVGAVSLSACSTSEDVEDVNPTFDGEAVKTQFTLSFAQSVAKTRQTAATVQTTAEGGNITISGFRGMDNIVLYPFAATAAAGATPNPITSESNKLGEAITLSKMIKPTTNDNADNSIPAGASGLTENNNSVLFNDVTIPIGTGSFLFYGKAIDESGKDNFYNGSLTMTKGTTPNPGNIYFDLDPTYTSTNTEAIAVGTALASYLSQIAQANNWADCAVSTNSSETWYNAGLGDLYTKFVGLKAGSSLTVQAAVQDLYSSIRNNTDVVSIAIKDAILSSNDPTNHGYTVTYAKDDNVDGDLEFQSNIGNSAETNFPGNINLPDGAALLEYTSDTKTFSQKNDGNGNTGDVTAKYTDYVYPASLYYYCNSGIGTAIESKATLYESTSANWDAILGGYTPSTQVKSSTRSVAILDPIEYAVGRLDMTVKTLPNATMYDKKGEAYDASAGFEVTGILIGGQKQVKFDFTTNTSATPYTIYDNITKSQPGETRITVTPSAASAANYTLALETVKDEDVYVAVEFLNKGADFEGIDGVIPAGCKFYLVGKLSPKANSGVSGYDETNMNQVFKQDYKTIATFSIAQGNSKTTEGFSENTVGLGKAYNTVPDLRTPQLELGLSVNLEWKSGIEFDVTF